MSAPNPKKRHLRLVIPPDDQKNLIGVDTVQEEFLLQKSAQKPGLRTKSNKKPDSYASDGSKTRGVLLNRKAE